MPAVLDPFIPRPDARERQEIIVRAPAGVVLETARDFNLRSLPLVRAIFWLRAAAMGAKRRAGWKSEGMVAEMLAMGWGPLAEGPGRFFVAGAACQPWRADVIFEPILPDRFAAYAEPDRVKIAWTLEAEPLGPAVTRFATETRAVATDDQARRRFLRYWGRVRIGVRAIRWLLLPALRRQAERRWRAAGGTLA
jgi:hypothetical protein